jgi:hypothetical protein
MTLQERKVLEQARDALQTGLVWTEYAKDVCEIDDALTAVNELLAQQGRVEKQIGEIIESLRCPNCASLEAQNAELDLRLAEQDQVPFGFLTNKRQRVIFEPNATGVFKMPMSIDWSIPLYSSPQPQRPVAKPHKWVGLDNDDLVWIYSNSDKVGQAISNTEAKLKGKNSA